MSAPKPKRFWIRKGTGDWNYETEDEDYNTVVMLNDSYYDAVSFIPAINGIEVVEASAYAELEARIAELEVALKRIAVYHSHVLHIQSIFDIAREVLAKKEGT